MLPDFDAIVHSAKTNPDDRHLTSLNSLLDQFHLYGWICVAREISQSLR